MRLLWRITWCAAAGAALSVAVAWACAWDYRSAIHELEHIRTRQVEEAGWPRRPPPGWPPPNYTVSGGRAGVRSSSFYHLKGDQATHGARELSAGWPLVCLTASAFLGSDGDFVVVGPGRGLVFGSLRQGVYRRGRFLGDSKVLPLWPRWAGLAANAALYGAAVGLTGNGLRRFRGRRRRRQGRCTVCAYDLRGLSGVCPECGNDTRSEELPSRWMA